MPPIARTFSVGLLEHCIAYRDISDEAKVATTTKSNNGTSASRTVTDNCLRNLVVPSACGSLPSRGTHIRRVTVHRMLRHIPLEDSHIGAQHCRANGQLSVCMDVASAQKPCVAVHVPPASLVIRTDPRRRLVSNRMRLRVLYNPAHTGGGTTILQYGHHRDTKG